MKKFLISAFDPFGGEKINSSLEILNLLPEKTGEKTIKKVVLPTMFFKSFDVLKEEIEKENPDVVICLGQAGGRKEINLERIAVNIMDAEIPDNQNYKADGVFIKEEGPAAYFTNLPVKKIKDEVQNVIPIKISNNAGTFVCNYILYSLLDYIYNSNKKIMGGFVHLPYLKKQAEDKKNITGFSEEELLKGVVAIINSI